MEGITGFSEEDTHSVFSFMKYAIQLANSGDNSEVNAAVIVDPSVKQVNGDSNLDVDSEGCSGSLSARPYLCTCFDVYLVWEPCILCEMALVHQRIRRIFLAYRNAKAGALGSVHRLQGQRSLNHHYAVFKGLIRDGQLKLQLPHFSTTTNH